MLITLEHKNTHIMKNNKIDWLNHFIGLLVVFLGVTAGFILQNRKETSANKELEQKYLTGFYDDVKENILELKDAILSDSLWVEQNKYAIKLMVKDSLSTDSANVLVKNMANFSKISAQTNTYENITNSGSLNLISDYNLKQTIVKYHTSLKGFELLDDYFQNHNSNNFMPFLMHNYDIFKQEFVNKNGGKLPEFKNLFAAYFSLTQQRLEGYQRLLKESIEFQQQLEMLDYISADTD